MTGYRDCAAACTVLHTCAVLHTWWSCRSAVPYSYFPNPKNSENFDLRHSRWRCWVCCKQTVVLKTLFIIPTDAHNYKIIGMLKTIIIPTIAATCFGPRRNHHQGAILCLAKATIMILLCSSLMTWSMLWRHTSLLWKHAVHGRGNSSLIVGPAWIETCRSNSRNFNCF